MERKEVVFVLGGPGSGKGTQCARIASELGYAHLSTGDLLREEQKKESDLATKIDECIRDGLLVPSSTMVALLKEAIVKGGSERFLIDGFPRGKENLDAWFQAFSDDEVQVKFVLFLHCPKDELTKRLLERGKTSGRADDNIESVMKRFDTFEKESLPVVQELDRLGMVRKVSTVPPKELVYHRIRRLFRGCRLVDPVERTLTLIKPDATRAGKGNDIVKRAQEEGFVVVGQIEGRTWSKETAEEFYVEHRGKAFYDDLVAFMSSGPVVQLCLEKVDAIKAWRKLAGPTDSIEAKALDPSSLRALYGTDGTRNAVHGSDSFASALREVNFCFNKVATSFSDEREQGSGEAEREGNGGFGPEERTLALLQPGVSELRSDDIVSVLHFRGFQVLKTTTQVMKEEQVRSFFQELPDETWFQDLCTLMTDGGETMALCLARIGAVAAWQSLVGPSDPAQAKKDSPRCLRAMYGEDCVQNAVFASNSQDGASRDLAFWFPEISRKTSSTSAEMVEHARGDPKYDEMMSYMKQKVDPVISPLLERVLKARPEDIVGFAAQDMQQQLNKGSSETMQAS